MSKRMLGIIEGFYGEPWSWETRGGYPAFLAKAQLNTYIYAPKSDAKLRKQWREPWTARELETLVKLASRCQAEGIRFGLGLSPYGLGERLSDSDRRLMLRKLAQIAELPVANMAILFDDMQSTGPAMLSQQLKVVDMVAEQLNAQNVIVCPSYYSTDPILEKLFGEKPKDYWSDLGRYLDSHIDIFWTGEKVCSEHYSASHLGQMAEVFKRKVVLWDNYPVNDGQKLSQFLHLKPFNGDVKVLEAYTRGHLANPMNQAHLSQLPLSTLSALYAGCEQEAVWENWLVQLEAVFQLPRQTLIADIEQFQTVGLGQLKPAEKQALIDKYKQLSHPMAIEIVDWLSGCYRFDPACLTD